MLGLLLATPASADAPASDPETAAFEVQFLEEMIDHHQMAVHMSHLCMESAVHESLRSLCERTASTQASEIAQMRTWLLDWYGIDHEPRMDDPQHHKQMMELESLSGSAFEAAFLRMMIEHHAIAVVDGRECMREAEHAELAQLCRDIFRSQLREIVQMRVWLCRWNGQCSFRSPVAARA